MGGITQTHLCRDLKGQLTAEIRCAHGQGRVQGQVAPTRRLTERVPAFFHLEDKGVEKLRGAAKSRRLEVSGIIDETATKRATSGEDQNFLQHEE